MSGLITDDEWATLQFLTEDDLVALAVELDIVAPAVVDARPLLEQCVLRLVEHAAQERLPFSKYDADDLAALPPDQLAAIAKLQGTPARVDAILKVGKTVYKTMEKRRGGNPIGLLLPSLLGPVARAAIALDGATDALRR